MADVRTTVVFRAEDQATPTLAYIGGKFKEFKNSIDQDAFKGWNRNFRTFKGALGKVGGQLESAAKTLAVPFSIAAGAIGFSLGNVVKNYMTVGDQLDKAMIRTGASAESLQTLQYAASMAGSSAETMSSSLVKLNQNMANAAAGKNKDLSELFDKLGISLKNADGSLKTATDVLPAFADAIQQVKDPALRTRMAIAAFGRQGAELIPTLEGGSEGLRQAAERAKQLGLVMSEKQIKNAAAFGDALSELGMVASAFGNQIGASVAPALTSLSGKLTDVIAKNQGIFNEKLTVLAEKFASAIEKINFEAVIDGLFRFGAGVADAFDLVGGFEGVLTGFGVVIGGKVLSGVLSFSTNLMTLGKSAFALVPAIKAVGVAIAGAMGPIGLIGTAVAAAAGLIIANWDTIGPKVSETWNTVQASVSEFCDWIGGFFSDFWNNLDFTNLVGKAFNLSPAVAAFNLLPDAWQNVLKDLISRVENFFKDLWGRFIGFFSKLDFTEMLPDSVKGITKTIGGAFGKVKNLVGGAVDAAKSFLPSFSQETVESSPPTVTLTGAIPKEEGQKKPMLTVAGVLPTEPEQREEKQSQPTTPVTGALPTEVMSSEKENSRPHLPVTGAFPAEENPRVKTDIQPTVAVTGELPVKEIKQRYKIIAEDLTETEPRAPVLERGVLPSESSSQQMAIVTAGAMPAIIPKQAGSNPVIGNEQMSLSSRSSLTQLTSRQKVEGELKIKVEATNGATAEVEQAKTSEGLSFSGDVGLGRIGEDR